MLSTEFPLPRFSFSTAFAAAVTAGLLWLMQDLISHHGPIPDRAEPAPNLSIVRLPEPEPYVAPEVEPPIPVVPPPPTRIKTVFEAETHSGWTALAPVDAVVTPTISGGGLPDGDMLPIVKVAPVYPNRAITRGIEGWVLLTFTVDESGAVRDPHVIESSPAGIFEQAALRAVLRFKYKPRVLNGTPVAVEGVQHRLTFELSDA